MQATLILLISFLYLARPSSILTAIGSLPNVQLFKHNQRTIDNVIAKEDKRPINHKHFGASCGEGVLPVPPSFRTLRESLVVGHGLKDFKRASELMFSFDAVDALPWASIVTSTGVKRKDLAVGTGLCTLIKCYKSVWTLNPCRITHLSRGKGTNMNSGGSKLVDQIAYSTVEGHLISGEERFRVTLENNGDVIFGIYSFTRGAGAIGTLAMPFIRPIQSSFFKQVTLSMKNLMARNRL